MKAVVRMRMFSLPNFLRPDAMPNSADFALDVGACFPTDADARRFWDDCRDKWVQHVAQRRKQTPAGETDRIIKGDYVRLLGVEGEAAEKWYVAGWEGDRYNLQHPRGGSTWVRRDEFFHLRIDGRAGSATGSGS